VKRPERNLLLALSLGTAALIAIYLSANVGLYARAVRPHDRDDRPRGGEGGRSHHGSIGGTLVSLTILLSIIGASNGGDSYVCARLFRQARDGLFFRSVGNVHPRFETPHIAIVVQGSGPRCWHQRLL